MNRDEEYVPSMFAASQERRKAWEAEIAAVEECHRPARRMNEATDMLEECSYSVQHIAHALRTLGMNTSADKLFRAISDIDYASEQAKKAFDESQDRWLDSVNQGTANMMSALLHAPEIAAKMQGEETPK